MSVIECNGLAKMYGSKAALNNLSFTIEENKITGLIGRNGAGKTTLLKIIAGYFKKSSGEIRVLSESPFNSLKVSSNMIFIDDNMTFPASLGLIEILTAAGSFYKNWNLELATALLNYFNLNRNQKYSSLSKGMKSTFNMIIGLSARAEITILDEPTTGMDAAVRKDVYRALLKDYVKNPRTIILSSHHLNEIEDILEDILLLKDGEKCLHLPMTDLKELAVGLKGKENIIAEFTKNMEVIHKESYGKDSSYVVVKKRYDEINILDADSKGIEIVPVSADEICIYLTAKFKEGIDDVLNRN